MDINSLKFGENKLKIKLRFAKARKQLFYLLGDDYVCACHLVEKVVDIILKWTYLIFSASQIYTKGVCKFITSRKWNYFQRNIGIVFHETFVHKFRIFPDLKATF